MFNKKNLNLIIFILLIVISVVHGIAMYFFLYWKLKWIDIILHFLGGLFLGFLAIWLIYFSGRISSPEFPRWFVVLAILSGVALGGVLWEFSEFGIDYLIAKKDFSFYNQLGVKDTMSDLFFDLIGGLIASALFLCENKQKQTK